MTSFFNLQAMQEVMLIAFFEHFFICINIRVLGFFFWCQRVSFASVLLAQLVDCQLSAEIVMRLQRPLNINWRFVKALRVDQRLYNNIYVLR